MFGANFNLVTRVDEKAVIFGTLKDSSFQISNLPSNNCFKYQFCIAWTILFCSNFISTLILISNVWRDFRLPISASAMLT